MQLKQSVINRNLLLNIDVSKVYDSEERTFILFYRQIYNQYKIDESNNEHSKSKEILFDLEQTEMFTQLVEKEKTRRGQEAFEAYRANIINVQPEQIGKYKTNSHDKQKEIYSKSCQEPKEPTSLKEKTSIKEKLANSLGTFGVIIFFLMKLIIYVLPFVMIGGNFFVTLFLVAINTFVPFSSVVFWIWGLVCAIKGVQDFWAILYYVCFAVIWLPFYIEIIASIFSKKK